MPKLITGGRGMPEFFIELYVFVLKCDIDRLTFMKTKMIGIA